jgi:hypothetical protein
MKKNRALLMGIIDIALRPNSVDGKIDRNSVFAAIETLTNLT